MIGLIKQVIEMEIRDVEVNERSGEVVVTALFDDAVQVSPATWEQPAEYKSGHRITSFFLEDIDFDVNDTNALETYLEKAYWEPYGYDDE